MNRQAFFAAMPGPLQTLSMALIDYVGLSKVDSRSWDAGAAARLRRASEIDLARILHDPKIDEEWKTIQPEIDALKITDMAYAVNPGDRRAIYYLVRGLGIQSILELGTHIGGSTLHFSVALRQTRRSGNSDVSLVTVDIASVNDPVTQPWKQMGSTHSPGEMVRMANCQDFVTFVTMNSLDYYPTCNRRFDMVFIDSSHSAKATWLEVVAAMKILNQDGMILLHDYYPNLRRLWPTERPIPGPFRAMRHLQKKAAGSSLKIIPLGELPWPTRLGTSMTSLALIARL